MLPIHLLFYLHVCMWIFLPSIKSSIYYLLTKADINHPKEIKKWNTDENFKWLWFEYFIWWNICLPLLLFAIKERIYNGNACMYVQLVSVQRVGMKLASSVQIHALAVSFTFGIMFLGKTWIHFFYLSNFGLISKIDC